MKKGAKVFDIILVVLAVIFVILACQITPFGQMTASSEGFYPVVVSIISLILAAANFLKSNAERKKNGQKAEEGDSVFDKDVVVMIGLLVLYIVLIFLVHYIIATLVFTTLAILYLSGRDWKTSLLVGFIATMMIVLVFKYGFSVILP
ncbi:MAG TPA: hypothetical protein DCF49_09480 [Lachnospiraceae bacterium]|nr:hypothetical protein [Lachnospiraceae bacterium]